MRVGALVLAVLAMGIGPVLAEEPGQLKWIQDAYVRSLVLERILADPARVDAIVKGRVATLADLKTQVTALASKQHELSLHLVDLIGADLAEGKLELLDATLTALEAREFPGAQAFTELATMLKARLRYDPEGAQELPRAGLDARAKRLVAFLAARRADRDRDPSPALAPFLGQDIAHLWAWFSNIGMDAAPDAAELSRAEKLDLNSATELQLRQLPGVSQALARALIQRRTQEGAFTEFPAVDSVPGLNRAVWEKLTANARVGDFVHPEREWTVLVYSAFANNLEFKGTDELNAMETIGSGKDVNIVNQIARIDGKQISQKGATDDRTNGNWAAVRRYLVVRDEEPTTITSPLVHKLGTADMGNPTTLVDFCRWGIKYFPARRYWLVIRNHGGGAISGIGQDDLSHNIITVPQLREALATVNAEIAAQRGRPDARIEILNLQACLMGSVEIAHELEDQARILCASEAESTGEFEWASNLAELTANPTVPARDFAVRMVQRRVQSIMDDRRKGYVREHVTFAAYDLAKLAPLRGALDRLAQTVSANLDASSRAMTDAATSAARYEWGFPGYAYVDTHGYCDALARETPDAAVASAARGVCAVLGYPAEATAATAATTPTIELAAAGDVVWGFNDFSMAPKPALWPPQSRPYLTANDIRSTAVQGSDGRYRITFPCMDAYRDSVRSISWRAIGADGTLGPAQQLTDLCADNREAVATTFGPDSPLIAEGHSGGYRGAHGLSLVVVPPPDARYRRHYAELRWAHDTAWGPLLERLAALPQKAD